MKAKTTHHPITTEQIEKKPDNVFGDKIPQHVQEEFGEEIIGNTNLIVQIGTEKTIEVVKKAKEENWIKNDFRGQKEQARDGIYGWIAEEGISVVSDKFDLALEDTNEETEWDRDFEWSGFDVEVKTAKLESKAHNIPVRSTFAPNDSEGRELLKESLKKNGNIPHYLIHSIIHLDTDKMVGYVAIQGIAQTDKMLNNPQLKDLRFMNEGTYYELEKFNEIKYPIQTLAVDPDILKKLD